MEVSLSDFELLQAAIIGAERNIKSKRKNYQDSYGYQGRGWDTHIDGACAEIAVAKSLGLFWNGNEFKSGGDVGNLEVRSTPRVDGKLILHPEDPDRIFILVRGGPIKWEIVGWIQCSEGRDPDYLKPGLRPAYFVPDGALHPLSELDPAYLKKQKLTVDNFDYRDISW